MRRFVEGGRSEVHQGRPQGRLRLSGGLPPGRFEVTGSLGTEAYAGCLEWQARIFATLAGRQGHPGVRLLLGVAIRGGSFFGRWVLGVRRWLL